MLWNALFFTTLKIAMLSEEKWFNYEIFFFDVSVIVIVGNSLSFCLNIKYFVSSCLNLIKNPSMILWYAYNNNLCFLSAFTKNPSASVMRIFILFNHFLLKKDLSAHMIKKRCPVFSKQVRNKFWLFLLCPSCRNLSSPIALPSLIHSVLLAKN